MKKYEPLDFSPDPSKPSVVSGIMVCLFVASVIGLLYGYVKRGKQPVKQDCVKESYKDN